MKRRVLLLEPNYKNKYPPMGLMKLAMYHRLQGDDVVFFKGEFSEFVLTEILTEAIIKLCDIQPNVNWKKFTLEIKSYIQTGTIAPDSDFEKLTKRPFVLRWLDHFRKYFRTGAYYKNPYWDRVCITTLFTFYWDITIKTIEFAKQIVKDQRQVLIGGILASVVPDSVERATGIKPIIGSLHAKRLLDDTPINISIDMLPLDYSILEEIDYQYPASNAYYAYTTRGCVNHCKFCSVPVIEPKYRDYIPLKKRLAEICERFGEQRHLLLLDNNVFASKKFDKIIEQIRASGFEKGATFIQPNQLDIAIRQLKEGWNDRAYIKMAVRLLRQFIEKMEGENHDKYYALFLDNELLHDYTATKENILAVYEEIKTDFEKERSKKPLVRFIDFNQGIDARKVTPEKMTTLSTIAIRPLRIAFDNWAERDYYVRAIILAKRSGITQMSNYLLYNYSDKPIDLYRRLLLNIDLCESLNVNIYSFPMKYHPITEEQWFSNRDYLGTNWSRKAVRTVQAVLNSTKGKIGRGRTFFFKAFGRSEEEFLDMIQMPEAFIIKRWDAELSGLTGKWRKAYLNTSGTDRVTVDNIVAKNIFNPSDWKHLPSTVKKVLNFHLIEREAIPSVEATKKSKHISFFEASCTTKISNECRKLITKNS